MPLFTPQETRLLDELAPATVRTIGRPRISGLLALFRRAIGVYDAKVGQLNEARFHNNAFWLAASGVLGEGQITARQDLPESLKADLLSIVQMRLDAEQWRQYCGLDLPALPAVGPPASDLAANTEIHTAERIG